MDAPASSSASQAPTPVAAPRVMRFACVEPDREQIARLVHLQPGRDNHRRWFDLIDELLATLPRLMRPRGVFRIDEVASLQTRRITLASGAVFDGAISSFLAHSRLMATFVVTIGSGVERLSRGWLRAGKVMPGTIADAIASEAVEATAQRLNDEVRHWAQSRGMDITPPYSPGYCGMTVCQQVPLFASLPTQAINVRLTPSCLMVPVKSISGLIGIGPADLVSPHGYPCEACTHPDCMQRRAPLRPELRGQNWGAADETCPPPPGA